MSQIFKRFSLKPLHFLGLIPIASLALAGCSFDSALENIKTCSLIQMRGDSECGKDVNSFSKETSPIYATVNLKNASKGTKIKADLKYFSGKAGTAKTLLSKSIVTESNQTLITYHFKSDKDWALGDYEVVLTLETDQAKPLKKKFSITKQEN
jgi:hypothetical protein